MPNDKQNFDNPHATNDGFTQSTPARSLPFALLRARVAVMTRFTKFLSKRDKTEQQWRVLRLLGVEDDMDATRLAERACILAPSLTRIIKTLTAEGLIQSERDRDDKRRIRLSISETGKKLLQESLPEAQEIYRYIIDTFGQEKTDTLLDLLEELEHVLLEARTQETNKT